jgi:MerR family transcriptional regulator, light-induced transcriptional regulator
MKTFNTQIAQLITQQQPRLADAIVTRQYERQPELWKPFGSEGRDKSVRDMNYHLAYLTEAIQAADPRLFADYVAWVKELFANLNFPDEALLATLECTREVLNDTLSADMMAVVNEYLEAGLQQMRQSSTTTQPYITEESPLPDLAEQYIAALLRGERRAASQLILDAVEQGISIKDIYLEVFQRSQYEIGRRWMTNQISVAQEHYCTAATQLIMSQLYPHIFATDKIGRRFVAACIGGELHEIGVRMVADFFEMEGWDTYYMGANTPTDTILQAIADRQPDILGISATMSFHLSQVEDLITQVRATDGGNELKILVGGYPFKRSPDLWKTIGADGFAPDALKAIRVAQSLLT